MKHLPLPPALSSATADKSIPTATPSARVKDTESPTAPAHPRLQSARNGSDQGIADAHAGKKRRRFSYAPPAKLHAEIKAYAAAQSLDVTAVITSAVETLLGKHRTRQTTPEAELVAKDLVRTLQWVAALQLQFDQLLQILQDLSQPERLEEFYRRLVVDDLIIKLAEEVVMIRRVLTAHIEALLVNGSTRARILQRARNPKKDVPKKP